MDVYLGESKVSRRRFRELQTYLEKLQQQGFQEIKSPRFKVFLKHPERDDWAVVTKTPPGNFILVRGGLDFEFRPFDFPETCRTCAIVWCGACNVYWASLAGAGLAGELESLSDTVLRCVQGVAGRGRP